MVTSGRQRPRPGRPRPLPGIFVRPAASRRTSCRFATGTTSRPGHPAAGMQMRVHKRTRPVQSLWGETMLETLWLVHPDEAMCDAFRHRFDGLPGVRVIRGRFEDLERPRLLRHRRQLVRHHDGRDRRGRRPVLRRAAHAAGAAPDHGRVLRRAAGRDRLRHAHRPPVDPVPGPCPDDEGPRRLSTGPTRSTTPPGRPSWRSTPKPSLRSGRSRWPPCRRWGRGLGACPTARRRGADGWRPPIATSASRPIGSTGTSWWSVRRPSILTAASR